MKTVRLNKGWRIGVLFIGSFAAVTHVHCASSEAQRTTKPSFTLSISAQEASVRSGTDVQIDVVVTDVSSQEVLVETNWVRPYVEITDHITITNGSGGKAARTKLGRAASESNASLTGKIVDIQLKPNKPFTYKLDLSQLYDLTKPGKYNVQIQRLDSNTNSVVTSNLVTLTVTK
jgi:hypothetical protein